MKPIHIFKTGTHTDSAGKTLNFDENLLQESALAYDPALHQSPLVVGHPNTDDPAMGWVKSVSYSEKGLHAEPEQINVDFEELVKGGTYKKVSASFYLPDSPANPKPGTLYLRHVGFLGGKAPAIKGLEAIQFNDAEEGVINFDDSFEDGVNLGSIAQLFRNIKKFIIGSASIEEADNLIPDYMISELDRSADRKTTPADVNPAFEEEESDMDLEQAKARITELEGQNATLETENTGLKGQVASFEEQQAETAAAAKKAQIKSDVEMLVSGGHIAPADRERITAFCELLDTTEKTVSFGEGDDKTDITGYPSLINYLKTQKAVDFNEQSADQDAHNEPLNSDALAKKAVAYQEAQAKDGRRIDIATAVFEVQSQAE